MKIYAIKDRLLNYFMQPFAAHGDNDVKAALAKGINGGEIRDEITTNPHHFEIWALGTVEEDGHIHADREFICDCASLVRRSFRGEPGRERSRDPAAPETARGGRTEAPQATGAEQGRDALAPGKEDTGAFTRIPEYGADPGGAGHPPTASNGGPSGGDSRHDSRPEGGLPLTD